MMDLYIDERLPTTYRAIADVLTELYLYYIAPIAPGWVGWSSPATTGCRTARSSLRRSTASSSRPPMPASSPR